MCRVFGDGLTGGERGKFDLCCGGGKFLYVCI